MSYLNKNYVAVKQENFEEFLKALAVPDDHIEKLLKFKPAQKLVKDGDNYTLFATTPSRTKEIKFKPGVEFDDEFGPTKTPAKSTYVVDGNTVSQTINAEKGSATFKREYNGDDLVMTITLNSWSGVAKIYFKAE